ncbi:MAG: hypothetical protein V4683_03190, partial [Bacteroidota bacterium]
MKKQIIISAIFILIAIFSCNSSTNKSIEKTDENTMEVNLDDFYLIFTIDGKEVNIPIEEVSTSYNVALKKPIFKIMGGEYGKINLFLVTTADVTKPSTTPSGSTDPDDQINQGSVSLQNFPEK